MTYASNPLPLEFWTRLQVRLSAEYQAQRERLTAALAPTPVTVDNAEVVLQQAAPLRDAVFTQVRTLENMQVVLMVLSGHIRAASVRAEIPGLEDHIACLRNMAELQRSTLSGLSPRIPREQEVRSILSQYGALRNAGTGEITMSERARLRGITVHLPVVGFEDTVDYERGLRELQSGIDQKDAELQSLRVSTLMSLRLPDELAGVVQNFGVEMWPVPAPAALPPTVPAAEAQTQPALTQPALDTEPTASA